MHQLSDTSSTATLDDARTLALTSAAPSQVGGWTADYLAFGNVVINNITVNGKEGSEQVKGMMRGVMRDQRLAERRQLAARGVRQDRQGQRTIQLSAAMEQFAGDEAGRGLRKSSVSDGRRAVRRLMAITGDVLVSAITAEHIRKFLAAIQFKSGANGKSGKKEPAADSSRTIAENYLRRFFAYLIGQNLLGDDPMSGFKRRRGGAPAHTKRSLTATDLAKIFDSAKFGEWTKDRPDRYWCPIIGLLTGARINEVAQMKVADIILEDGIWCWSIRATRDRDGVMRGSVKNAVSVRIIPLPSRLLDLGFLDYVDRVREEGFERLFPHIGRGKDRWTDKDNGRSYGSTFGEQYRRYIKVAAPMEKGMAFHAFRHTTPGALKKLRVSKLLVASIAGWAVRDGGSAVPMLEERYDHNDITALLPRHLSVDDQSSLRSAQLVALDRFDPGIEIPRFGPEHFARAFSPDATLHL